MTTPIFFCAYDTGGVISNMEYLSCDLKSALKKFHEDHDDEYDGKGKPDPQSYEIATSDDDRYVILDSEIPNDVYTRVDENESGIEIYSDLPIKAMHISIDDGSSEPCIFHNEEVYSVSQLMESEELYLDDLIKIIAEYKQLRIVSTFHDYQLELMNEIDEVMDTHGMGDGVDDCEHSPGTFGHQLYMQQQLETQYSTFLEAYFSQYVNDAGEIYNPDDHDELEGKLP